MKINIVLISIIFIMTSLFSRKFVRQNDIVIDSRNKLMWQDNFSDKRKKIYHYSAKRYCKKLTLGGYSNWRMPIRPELLFIRDTSKYPAVNKIFKNMSGKKYWSELNDDDDDYNNPVDFEFGEISMRHPLYYQFNVICVRSILK